MTYIKKTLENGLRIILVPLKDSETVTVMTVVEAGSEYEDKKINGISHFLEHMCFKGTTKRPSSEIINYELDSMGSASNAFTGNDHTSYYAKAHASKTSELLDIVSDIYLNSVFPEEEIAKEKGVVIEEINMYEDHPQSKVWDVLAEAMYGDQPTGRTILGTKESVGALTRDELVAYRSKHYVPEATTVVISGKIDEEKMIADISAIFGSLPASSRTLKAKTVDEQSAPLVKAHYKESDQTHVVIAFRSHVTMYDEKIYPTGTLAGILGKGMSSRLFKKVREELGAAYYVSAGHNPQMDYGVFTVNAGVSNTNLVPVLQAIFAELKRMKDELVSEAELRKIKDLRKGHLYLGLESSDAWANFYGFQEIYHEDILSPEEITAKREAVTAEDVMAMAKEIFRPENVTIALIGPQKDERAIYDTIKL